MHHYLLFLTRSFRSYPNIKQVFEEAKARLELESIAETSELDVCATGDLDVRCMLVCVYVSYSWFQFVGQVKITNICPSVCQSRELDLKNIYFSFQI